ncbi:MULTISPECIES: hypothetical protein [Streptomyces]|uniref:hypothetical protein n=1 Tax=Streptomyces TaxID=1883 RepID=UPI0015CF571C|nr:hypothetical protein [Streptomyces sp. st115]
MEPFTALYGAGSGAPQPRAVRRRRDEKERGHVSAHYFVATHPLFAWLGRE